MYACTKFILIKLKYSYITVAIRLQQVVSVNFNGFGIILINCTVFLIYLDSMHTDYRFLEVLHVTCTFRVYEYYYLWE